MKSATAVLTFVYVSVLSAVGCGHVFSGLGQGGALFSLALGAFVAAFAWWKTEASPSPPIRLWDGLALAAFGLASLRAFLWLIYTRGDEVCVLSPNNLGDMSLHLDFIRYLASGAKFWPDSPILTGVPMAYPLGADLFNSLFEVLHFDTYRTLIWTALGGATLTAFLLWRWGGAFTLAAFLFNGGLAGFVILRGQALQDFQSELVWKNFFLSMFVTQRGLLVALPAGLLLLYAWREAYFRSGKQLLPLWLQVLLYSALPLFNFHAFLFLSAILAVAFILKASARKDLLSLVGLSLIPGTLCVLLVTACFTASGIKEPWGGIMENKVFADWPTNFGLALMLVPALGVLLFFQRDPEARCFVWTSIVIFVVCCLVKFAPWSWDNMKLVLWCWLALAPYIWSKLLALQTVPVRVVLCLALFFSGAISLIGGLDGRQGYGIAHRSELAQWQETLRGISPEARFACVPDYNNPLLLLGRKVVCGYNGHLWSHGLEYKEKYSRLQQVLAREPGWEQTAADLGADYVVFRTDGGWQAMPEIFKVKPATASPASR